MSERIKTERKKSGNISQQIELIHLKDRMVVVVRVVAVEQ